MTVVADGDGRDLVEVDEMTAGQRARRDRIIQAAFELGADRGYDAVLMRDVAATAGVSSATIYRYFSSKDELLAAAMSEWAARLRERVVRSPPRGETSADRVIDVLRRGCRSLERQPKLAGALLRAISSSDRRVVDRGEEVQRMITVIGDSILEDLSPDARFDILATLGHVWYATLLSWANGQRDIAWVDRELERAVRALVGPHENRSS